MQFLNEAEPILKQIQAPRLALLLRKRVAELAGVSLDEMRGMIKLPDLNSSAQPRRCHDNHAPRFRCSAGFVLMLLMQPALANAADLDWVQGNAEDDLLVVAVIRAALAYPNAHAASLLRQLEGEIDGRLMRELERELHLLDESLDFALEFNGARKHLIETYMQRDQSKLLGYHQGKEFE